ncbi:hypothetical protein H4S01_003550, partial [Coemansia sp. RSA 2610]
KVPVSGRCHLPNSDTQCDVKFVDFVPAYTEIAQFYTTVLSEYTPAVAEVLLPTAPESDPDSEKHELTDKERKLQVLPRRALYEPCLAAALIFAHSEPRPLCEAPIHDSADSDELARPVRNIEAVQAQGGAEQTEGTAASVLARANRELGLALATDKVAYLADTYLDMQATDAGIVRNPTDTGLMMFAQDAKDGRIPYPMDPNSAELNMTAAVAHNVHALAIMPYSERVVRTETNLYTPQDGLVLWGH